MGKQSPTSLIVSTGIITIALTTIVALYFTLNTSRQEPVPQGTRPTIATTIFPIYDITKNIVGDGADVLLLVPSGASPHSYALTIKQITSIQQAQLLFAIGHGLDDSVTESVAKIANVPITIVDKQITLHTYDAQNNQTKLQELININTNLTDPHYWLTVPNAKQIATTITSQIQAQDLPNANRYSQNLATYLEQLDRLEDELQALSQEITQPAFITVHNTWSYFAEQYHLKTVGSYEPVEGKEPSIHDIQGFQQTIKQYNLKTFFTEPQKPISAATALFKNEFGLDIAVLDPIGGGEEGDSYIKLMRRNMHSIKNAGQLQDN